MEAFAEKADFDGIKAAARRLVGKAVRTPLIENAYLNERVGGRVFLKAEILQHCGSFKFRGAYNRLSVLGPDVLKAGVVAWSSGNHAQGVALAARMLGVPATIVMPSDAPDIKRTMVQALGATIVPYERADDDREAIAHDIAARTGAVIAPSYDHPMIINGQGTVGLEIAEDLSARDIQLDAAVICCGGGGLASGTGLALTAFYPDISLITAEPEGYDDTARSLASGRRETADVSRPTICDAIATPTPGALTFPILQSLATRGVSVTEHDVRRAVQFAFDHLKLIVEPGGAVALAALLTGAVNGEGRNVAVTLSGGNVDRALFAKLIAKETSDHR